MSEYCLEKDKYFVSSTTSFQAQKIVCQDDFILEKAVGFNTVSKEGLCSNPVSGAVAYPAAHMIVILYPKTNEQKYLQNSSGRSVQSVQFSEDGVYLAAGDSGRNPKISIWHTTDYKHVNSFVIHEGIGIKCLLFLRKSSCMVVLTDQSFRIELWGFKNGQRLATANWQTKPLAITIPLNGEFLVACGYRKITLFDLGKAKSNEYETNVIVERRAVLLGKQSEFTFIDICCGKGKYSKNVYTITSSGYLCEIKLGDILIDKAAKIDTKVFCIKYGLDSLFLACPKGIVKICHPSELSVTAAVSISQMLRMHPKGLYKSTTDYDTYALVISEQDSIVTSVYSDFSLYSWHVRSCNDAIECAVIIPTSDLCNESCTNLSNLKSSREMHVLEQKSGHTALSSLNINSGKGMMFDPNALASRQSVHGYYGVHGGGFENNMPRHHAKAMRISPDGKDVIIGNELGEIRVYNAQTKNLSRVIEAHNGPVTTIALMYDTEWRLVASGGRDRYIFVLDAAKDFSLVQVLCDHSAVITDISIVHTSDVLTLVSAAADGVILVRRALPGPELKFTIVGEMADSNNKQPFDVKGELLATGQRNGNIKVFKADPSFSTKKVFTIKERKAGALRTLDIDPSGSFVVASTATGHTRVYHIHTGQLVSSLNVQTGNTLVKFSKDMRYLVCSSNNCALMWRLPERMTDYMKARTQKVIQIEENEISMETYMSCLRVCEETTTNLTQGDYTSLGVLKDHTSTAGNDNVSLDKESMAQTKHPLIKNRSNSFDASFTSSFEEAVKTPSILSLNLMTSNKSEADESVYSSTIYSSDSYLSCSTCQSNTNTYQETDSSIRMHSLPNPNLHSDWGNVIKCMPEQTESKLSQATIQGNQDKDLDDLFPEIKEPVDTNEEEELNKMIEDIGNYVTKQSDLNTEHKADQIPLQEVKKELKFIENTEVEEDKFDKNFLEKTNDSFPKMTSLDELMSQKQSDTVMSKPSCEDFEEIKFKSVKETSEYFESKSITETSSFIRAPKMNSSRESQNQDLHKRSKSETRSFQIGEVNKTLPTDFPEAMIGFNVKERVEQLQKVAHDVCFSTTKSESEQISPKVKTETEYETFKVPNELKIIANTVQTSVEEILNNKNEIVSTNSENLSDLWKSIDEEIEKEESPRVETPTNGILLFPEICDNKSNHEVSTSLGNVTSYSGTFEEKTSLIEVDDINQEGISIPSSELPLLQTEAEEEITENVGRQSLSEKLVCGGDFTPDAIKKENFEMEIHEIDDNLKLDVNKSHNESESPPFAANENSNKYTSDDPLSPILGERIKKHDLISNLETDSCISELAATCGLDDECVTDEIVFTNLEKCGIETKFGKDKNVENCGHPLELKENALNEKSEIEVENSASEASSISNSESVSTEEEGITNENCKNLPDDNVSDKNMAVKLQSDILKKFGNLKIHDSFEIKVSGKTKVSIQPGLQEETKQKNIPENVEGSSVLLEQPLNTARIEDALSCSQTDVQVCELSSKSNDSLKKYYSQFRKCMQLSNSQETFYKMYYDIKDSELIELLHKVKVHNSHTSANFFASNSDVSIAESDRESLLSEYIDAKEIEEIELKIDDSKLTIEPEIEETKSTNGDIGIDDCPDQPKQDGNELSKSNVPNNDESPLNQLLTPNPMFQTKPDDAIDILKVMTKILEERQAANRSPEPNCVAAVLEENSLTSSSSDTLSTDNYISDQPEGINTSNNLDFSSPKENFKSFHDRVKYTRKIAERQRLVNLGYAITDMSQRFREIDNKINENTSRFHNQSKQILEDNKTQFSKHTQQENSESNLIPKNDTHDLELNSKICPAGLKKLKTSENIGNNLFEFSSAKNENWALERKDLNEDFGDLNSPVMSMFLNQEQYLQKLKEVRQVYEMSIQALSNERQAYQAARMRDKQPSTLCEEKFHTKE